MEQEERQYTHRTEVAGEGCEALDASCKPEVTGGGGSPECVAAHLGATARKRRHDRFRKYAKLVNIVLNPYLVILYLTLILLFGNTLMDIIPFGSRWYFLVTVSIGCCLMPALTIWLMNTFGLMRCTPETRKYYGFATLLMTLACFLFCIWLLRDMHAAYLVRRVLIAASGSMAIGAVVGLFIYVSPYMVAVGAGVTTLLWLDISGLGNLFWPIVAAVLLAGALASARMYLGRETYSTGIVFFGSAISTAVLLIAL